VQSLCVLSNARAACGVCACACRAALQATRHSLLPPPHRVSWGVASAAAPRQEAALRSITSAAAKSGPDAA
jgi:hypothetical protein